jgi:hypothetical protein
MKVIRKEREQYDAFKWEGVTFKDYERFLAKIGAVRYIRSSKNNFDFSIIYFKRGQTIYGMKRGEYYIKAVNYNIFNRPEVLSEKEFKEQYEVIE